MAAELIVAPEAERDIEEAYDWYEGQRVGLGEEFLTRPSRNQIGVSWPEGRSCRCMGSRPGSGRSGGFTEENP
jgi:hypothetical protein